LKLHVIFQVKKIEVGKQCFIPEIYLIFLQCVPRMLTYKTTYKITRTDSMFHGVMFNFTHTSFGMDQRWMGLLQIFTTAGHVEKNSVALVGERTVPTERQLLVGEVSAKFSNRLLSHTQCNGSPTAVTSVSRPESLLFLSSSSSIAPTKLSEFPFQTHGTEYLVAPGIEPGHFLTTIPQRRFAAGQV
jgi:hypothetical protein